MMMMMTTTTMKNILQNHLLPKSFERDDRDIDYVLPIPLSSWWMNDGTFCGAPPAIGIKSAPIQFWVQMSTLITIGNLISALCGLIIYMGIIQDMEEKKKKEEKQGNQQGTNKNIGGTTQWHHWVLAFGIVTPFSLTVPLLLAPMLNLRNTAFVFSMCGTLPLTPFRCLEALFGTTPRFAIQDLSHYLLYYTSIGEFNIVTTDSEKNTTTGSSTSTSSPLPPPQIKKATSEEIWYKSFMFLRNVLEISILFSFLEATNYQVLSTPPSDPNITDNTTDGFWNLFHWKHLVNNYILAYATGLFLEAGTLYFGLGISLLSGLSTSIVNDSPLTKTSSPSNFWGGRWNKQIHTTLKRSVYLPIRNTWNSSSSSWTLSSSTTSSSSQTKKVNQTMTNLIAALATFVASGVLHEYILLVIAQKQQSSTSSSLTTTMQPTETDISPTGSHLAFFAWNGVVICLERILVLCLKESATVESTTSSASTTNATTTASTSFVASTSKWLIHFWNHQLPTPIRTAFVIMTVLPISHWFTDTYIANGMLPDFALAFPQFVWISS